MGEAEDGEAGGGEEAGVVDRGAVVEGLVERVFFEGYGRVVEVYEAVGGAREEDGRV